MDTQNKRRKRKSRIWHGRVEFTHLVGQRYGQNKSWKKQEEIKDPARKNGVYSLVQIMP